jgi:acyl-CoA synthetase (NDP forming)
MTAYPSVLEVPEEIDMAVIVINAKYVLSAIDQCHQKGIKGIVVISAGFKETGAAGAELEAELVAKIREYDMTWTELPRRCQHRSEIQTRCLLCRISARSR